MVDMVALSFMEAVAYVDDNASEFVISSKGLDSLTDLMEHLYHGGSIVDNAAFPVPAAQVMLAIIWREIRNIVVQYDEM